MSATKRENRRRRLRRTVERAIKARAGELAGYGHAQIAQTITQHASGIADEVLESLADWYTVSERRRPSR